MFMNIFTAISVDEVKDMIQNAKVEAIQAKMEFIICLYDIKELKIISKTFRLIKNFNLKTPKIIIKIYEFFIKWLLKNTNSQKEKSLKSKDEALLISQLNYKVESLETALIKRKKIKRTKCPKCFNNA
jgi:hypothetical protein